MGLFFSRKKPLSKKEILEGLEDEIKQLTDQRQKNIFQEKSFVLYLLLLSLVTYLIGALVFYLYYSPQSWLEMTSDLHRIYLVKKLLNMYFAHKKAQYDAQLTSLQAEKRKILNEVMETETYNVARELLQRFDPHSASLRAMRQRQETPERRQQNGGRRGGELRQRRPPQTPHPALQPHPVVTAQTVPRLSQPRPVVMVQQPLALPPAPPSPPPNSTDNALPQQPEQSVPRLPSHHTSQFIPPGMCLGPAPGPPTPSPILPRERTGIDKMVEYLVGDGPNNRYALICSSCHSHNGMALGDEFEYTTFRCAYCYTLNPARRNKPSLTPQTPTSGDPPNHSTGGTVATETEDTGSVSTEMDRREENDASEQDAVAEPDEEVRGQQETEPTD